MWSSSSAIMRILIDSNDTEFAVVDPGEMALMDDADDTSIMHGNETEDETFGASAAATEPTGGGDNDDDAIPPHDSVTIIDTFQVYGTFFVCFISLFCFLRVKFPRTYNLRSWVPHLRCDLAREHFGYIDWAWKVWYISDDDFRDQCGMDALCFIRILYFGLRVALVGMFNSIWLIPTYYTSADSPVTAHITDPVAKMSVSNVPPSSNRLLATVFGIYIMFGYIFYLILKEFEWFTEQRNKYLMRKVPQNYSVYVSHIPQELRSSDRLLRFFQDAFSPGAVLEAHVSLQIPGLDATVARREGVVERLEHALALEDMNGVSPMHLDVLKGGKMVDSIQVYTEQLDELNRGVRETISFLEIMHEPRNYQDDLEASLQASIPRKAPPRKDLGDDNGHHHQYHHQQQPQKQQHHQNQDYQPVVASDVREIGRENNDDDSDGFEITPTSPYKYSKGATMETMSDLDDSTMSKTNGGSLMIPGGVNPGALLTRVVGSATQAAGELANNTAALGGLANTMANNMANTMASTAGGLATSMMDTATGLATSAGGLIGIMGENGIPREAGFVTFTKLSSTQAALQMVHHPGPHSLLVEPAPDPDDLFWMNVGRSHYSLQVGMLISLGLTATLCLFWTIPMAFIATISDVDSLKEKLPFLEKWVAQAPWLEAVLGQIAPLLLMAVNGCLPILLEKISAFEGPISSSVLESATFLKLSAFMIIQTFFVSTISGSIMSEIAAIIDDWTRIIDILATSLPGQSTFYVQLLLVQTFLGLVMELLRVLPLTFVAIRTAVGPNLTPREREKVTGGGWLIPMTQPWNFEYAEVSANNILYFMVQFVYSATAPLTTWFMAFCFVLMISGYRHQLIYNYPTMPDSGGQIWTSFIQICFPCIMIAQVTLIGLLLLKKSAAATPLMLPLIVLTVLFRAYIEQRHFKVSKFLPSRECLKQDLRNNAEGPMDYTFLRRRYVQPSMRSKRDVQPANLTVAREIAQQHVMYMTPPGSEADMEPPADQEDCHLRAGDVVASPLPLPL